MKYVSLKIMMLVEKAEQKLNPEKFKAVYNRKHKKVLE